MRPLAHAAHASYLTVSMALELNASARKVSKQQPLIMLFQHAPNAQPPVKHAPLTDVKLATTAPTLPYLKAAIPMSVTNASAI